MNSFAIGLVWLALLIGLNEINESLKLIHQAMRDTNHAPTVVTNYVTVTQEFQRQHCDEPCNQWLGDGKIVTNDVGVEK